MSGELTVFVLCDALQGDAKEGGVTVIVPDQKLGSSWNIHTSPVENTRSENMIWGLVLYS